MGQRPEWQQSTGVLLVTGGGRGIGAATAVLAARRGYRVCVNFVRDGVAAEAVSRRSPPTVARRSPSRPTSVGTRR